MKNYLSILTIILLLFSGCSKESGDEKQEEIITISKGSVFGNESLYSEILGKNMNYSIYLPPNYSKSENEYPVLYLLHGMWGNYRDWVTNGMSAVMDDKINNNEASEMIVVMPDGIDAFYCNNYNGGNILYEDFMIQEFIPGVEKKYRIKAAKNSRAIAGLSMGGYGATFHAFKRPDMFSSCYSMSGALEMGSSAPDLKEIIDSKTTGQLSELPPYSMECGTEDALVFSANENFDRFLNKKEFQHNYIKRSGSHDWAFWMACLPNVLEFASSNFK